MTKGSVRESAGTCRRVATTGGTITTWRVYDGNGGSLPSSVLGNRYLFQGREYSWAIHEATGGTGIYNFRARYYDPLTGRWLSNDPIGISGGLNQYAFCANNPVMFGDPEGRSSEPGAHAPRVLVHGAIATGIGAVAFEVWLIEGYLSIGAAVSESIADVVRGYVDNEDTEDDESADSSIIEFFEDGATALDAKAATVRKWRRWILKQSGKHLKWGTIGAVAPVPERKKDEPLHERRFKICK